MKNRMNLLKVLFASSIMMPIALSAVSCSSYNNINNNSNSSSTTPNYPTFDNGSNSSTTQTQTSLPASVNTVVSRSDLNFSYLESNSYGLIQNYQEYGENNQLTYSTSETEIKNDITYFTYLLWKQNSMAFSVSNVNINNISFSNLDTDGKVKLGTSKVSFELEIEISKSTINELSIFDSKLPMATSGSNKLTIKVSDQVLYSTVNASSDNYFLGWKINNSTITLNAKSIQSSFTPTFGSYSNAFQYKFSGLSTKQNYTQLYKNYQSSVLNISNDDLKTNIANKYNSEYQHGLTYIDSAMGILNVLKTNPTIADLITGSSKYIANILVSIGLVPSYLKQLIVDAFAPGNSAKPFIDIVQENKDLIMDFLETSFGSVASVVEPYIDLLKPGISSSGTEYSSLNSLFDSFNLSSDIKTIIFDDLIGVDGKTPKTLVDILSSNIDKIAVLIDPSGSSNASTKAIVTLLKLMFSKNTTTNANNKFFDIISGSEKTQFYNALVSILGTSDSSILSILSIITQSNENFTTNNLITFVSALSSFLNELYEKNTTSSDSLTDSDEVTFLNNNEYKNITFTASFEKEPTIDKTNQTISFNYKIAFTINKKIDLSPVIKAFKNLLSVDTVSQLIKTATGTDLDAMLKDLWILKDTVKTKLINNLMNLIPTNLWVGADNGDKFYESNSVSTTYSADNTKIWLNPVLSGTDYKLGFQFAYNTNVKFDDPSLVNSIASNYSSKDNSVPIISSIIKINIYFYDLWKSVLQNSILRDYDFSNIFYSDAVEDTTIATTSTYDPNLYTTGLEINDKSSSVNQTNLVSSLGTINTTNVSSSYNIGNIVTWKDGNDSSSTYGLKPTLTSNQSTKIINDYISYDTSKFSSMFANTNLGVYSNANLIFNFDIPLKISQSLYGVNVNFNIKIFMLNIFNYSPLKLYNTTTKSLTNFINSNVFLLQSTDNSASSSTSK